MESLSPKIREGPSEGEERGREGRSSLHSVQEVTSFTATDPCSTVPVMTLP